MGIASSKRSGVSTFARYQKSSSGFTVPSVVTGGILYADSSYYYRVFLNNNSFVVSDAPLTADVLVIGGGGGGGGTNGGGMGGGGAGGVVYSTQTFGVGSFPVVVGAGSPYGNTALRGSSSQVGSQTAAIGGGGGISRNGYVSANNDGGSGGGASEFPNASTVGLALSGQGNNGGTGITNTGGGGGGGASGLGGNAVASTRGGHGGTGTPAFASWATATGTGVSGYYAGGGGGSMNSAVGGNAGAGGGGYGGQGSGGTSLGDTNGVISTGGGGGGAYQNTPGNGGSGIVIIRYGKSSATETGFVPTNISGLTVWYDLSDSTSVTLTSGLVSAVADKSGNNRNLTSYTAGTRPGYVSSQALTFNGAQYMYNDMGYTMPINRTMFAVVTLYQLDPPASSAGSGLMGFEYLGSDNFDTVGYNENSSRKWQFESSGGVHNVVGTVNETLANTRLLISSVQGSNDFRIYRNGALYLSGSQTAFNTETRFILGQRHGTQTGGAGNGFWYGTVSEVMAYNSSLNDTDRTTVETYLKNKWGTP